MWRIPRKESDDVSILQRCVHEFRHTRSMQLAQQEAYSHCDAAVDFGRVGWCGHEVTAGPAFSQRDAAQIDCFNWKRDGYFAAPALGTCTDIMTRRPSTCVNE